MICIIVLLSHLFSLLHYYHTYHTLISFSKILATITLLWHYHDTYKHYIHYYIWYRHYFLNVYSCCFLQQLFQMMAVRAVLMTKSNGLIVPKLLLHHQSKPSPLNHLLPLPFLCVSVLCRSSVRILFQRLYVTWQDQIPYEKYLILTGTTCLKDSLRLRFPRVEDVNHIAPGWNQMKKAFPDASVESLHTLHTARRHWRRPGTCWP